MNARPTDPVASTPLWRDTAATHFDGESLAQELEADVAIVGGGFTGLSTAFHLAKAGKSVVVLEREAIASGASGRNAAGWIPGWPGPSPDDVLDKLGRDRGERLNRMLASAARDFPDFAISHALDPEFRASGVAMCALTRKLAKRLDTIAEQWHALGVPIDPVAPAELSAITGSDAFCAAMIYRNAGTLNPVNYSHGLARLASETGAQIFVRSEVARIEPDDGGWRVLCAKGSVRSSHAIMATGAYETGLVRALSTSQYKIPIMVFASKPAPEIAARLMPGGMPIGSNHPLRLFWLMADGADRLIGSTVLPSSDNLSLQDLVPRFERHLKAYYPEAALPEWETAWSGYLDVVPDRLPRIVELAPKLLAPIGYSGSGIIATFAIGRELGRALGNDDLDNCAVPIRAASRLWAPKLVPRIFRAMTSRI